MKIITRKEAKAQGLKYYFTGKPCKHGHVSKREVKYRRCMACRDLEYTPVPPIGVGGYTENSSGLLQKIVNRAEARDRSLKFYFTGKPCKHGHIVERITNNATCTKCVEVREYKRLQANLPSKLKREQEAKIGYVEAHGEDIEIQTCKQAIAKGQTFYFPDHTCKLNHWAPYSTNSQTCMECKILHSRKSYSNNIEARRYSARIYSRENPLTPEQKIARVKYRQEWYSKNKEQVIIDAVAWGRANPEKRKIISRRYNENNPLASFYRRTLKRMERITGDHMSKYADAVGYDSKELRGHIESLFKEGMSWKKRKLWHLDHMISIYWFLSNGIEDISLINSLDNLRPLWATSNLSKRHYIDPIDLLNLAEIVTYDRFDAETVDKFHKAVDLFFENETYQEAA